MWPRAHRALRTDEGWAALQSVAAAEEEKMTSQELYDFVTESNRIEGIVGVPLEREVAAHEMLLAQTTITVALLQLFVRSVQPDAVLRERGGLDVRVGSHVPLPGGPAVRWALENLLDEIHAKRHTPYSAHLTYETLHPFTDGNGRSGRALWLWMMQGRAPLGFLHQWYYQSLQGAR